MNRRNIRRCVTGMLLLGVAVLGSAMEDTSTDMEVATFGGGCFWCVEAVFQKVPGVRRVT